MRSWLMANLEIAALPTGVDDRQTGTVETFVIGSKAVHAAEAYVLGLFQLYPTVYFHKATRGAEKLFSELLVRVVTLARDGSSALTGLPRNHPLVRFADDPENLEIALELDDSVIWGALPLMVFAEDNIISNLSKRLRDRNIYKCIDIRARVNHEFDPDMQRSDEQLIKIETCCARINEKLTDFVNTRSSGVPSILLDEAKRSPYKDGAGSIGPTDRINVRTDGGKFVDLKQRSRVVSSLSDFMLFRAYYDRDDASVGKKLEGIISAEVEGCR